VRQIQRIRQNGA